MIKAIFLPVLVLFVISIPLVLGWGAKAQAQKSRAAAGIAPALIQQPLYTEYKGVRLGMTAQEVRTKLGEPALAALKAKRAGLFRRFRQRKPCRLAMTPQGK